jgi:hypothetical protein
MIAMGACGKTYLWFNQVIISISSYIKRYEHDYICSTTATRLVFKSAAPMDSKWSPLHRYAMRNASPGLVYVRFSI